jgi:hypothetical protein
MARSICEQIHLCGFMQYFVVMGLLYMAYLPIYLLSEGPPTKACSVVSKPYAV